ncbi:MAG: hypothetical protein IJV27_05955 [Prevotella sp.]|nr:hypothetical protein [Prevotella sp.]
MIANSQWYLLARSLINTHMAWWGLPVFVYALLFSPIYIGKDAGFVQFFDFYAHTGEGFSFGNPLYYIGIITIIVSLLLLNRKIQHLFVWKELGKTETSSQRNIIKLEFLDRTGEISEYLKLEVKSILRNKNIKKGFISGTILILIFSLLLSFSTIYDGKYMSYFWCVYCFAIYGALLLVKIMCYEGNYIDALMVHKENIISLLRAKYYFYSILLVIPFVLMLPTVYMGKCTLMMLVSYALFTAGVDYFLFFQMAVFNKQSMPLNTKFIGKGSMENNWIQVGIQSFIFTFPWIYISILQLLLSDTLSYIIISLTGLAFIVTHPIWLQNIYRRMMVHRYENMEGFRNSR